MTDQTQNNDNRFYPLPCMITLASLFCGFYSIISAINSDFKTAASAILVATIFDTLDGRVARLTNSTSQFGAELDSLCDMVSFGVSPAVLAYLWALHPYGRYGWLAAFLYVAMTSLRLARFNSQDSTSESKNFVGLPCPAAAAMISAAVLFSHFLGITGEVKHISLLLLVYLLSYLMVSTHTYYSFKEIPPIKIKRFQFLIGFLLLFILVAAEPQIMLFILFLVYLGSGPIYALTKKIRLGKKNTITVKKIDH
ncbi:MAG TPA: CDP-diacylglycerol--serine O-phosphatidyltransferase [Desulfocapsa sulfexigens]|nr:CDP-diacylglycerol--serine O-phosphatidyltransferase [Desulfocapsa sulfexigens]